jgi:hypothetical protein
MDGARDARDGPVRTIILVRHGAYDQVATDNDHASLTPLGIAQARLVANRLVTLAPAPTELIASTMTRALQTEAIIHEAMPAVAEQRSDLLRECMPPLPKGTRIALPPRSAALALRGPVGPGVRHLLPASSQGRNRHSCLSRQCDSISRDEGARREHAALAALFNWQYQHHPNPGTSGRFDAHIVSG